MKGKLNERSEWLLRLLRERHPLAFAKNHRLPYSVDGIDQPLGIGMRNFRGLERAGLAREGDHGLLYITEKGLEYLENLKNDND